MADLVDIDNTAPADSLYEGSVKINLIRARLDGLYTILSDITAAEANQVENIATTTISAAQWAYLGALDQSIVSTASVDFGEVDITKTTTLAAGGFGLRCQVTHSTAGLTGTLRGAYIVATNAPFTASGTIRGAEIKARAATSGLSGGDVTTLEGVSISSDAKDKAVTTQRGMEVILDGQSGAAVTTGVGIRIANNYQANVAITSYALQIYRDSFDYTADIQLSGGGLIGGSTGKIKMSSSGVTALTLALGSDATGDIYYGVSGVLTILAKGTEDQVLTMGATVPEWAAAAGAGEIDISGTPVTNDYARWTDADTLEGRDVTQVRSDINVENGATADQTSSEIAALFTAANQALDLGSGGFTTTGTLNISGGTLTLAVNQISGDKVEGGTIAAITITALTVGTYLLPSTDGNADEVLKTDGSNTLSWTAAGAGDVTAGANLTDHAIVRGDTGVKGVQTSGITITDANVLTLAGSIDASAGAYDILIIDNSAAALEISQAANFYMRFVTTNDAEEIIVNKKFRALGDTEIEGSNFDINGGTIDNTAVGNGNPAAGSFTTLSLRLVGELRFFDDGNYVGFEAPALTDNQIWVLPDADGAANEVIKTDGAGNLTWTSAGGAALDLSNLTSTTINVSLVSDTDDTDDLGSAAKQWKDLYIDGTANIDSLVADTADIDGGTIDGVTIGATVAPTVTDLGSVATCDINGGAIDGVIIGAASAAALTCTTFTSTGIDDNADATAITIDSSEGVYIGDTENTFMTVGLTINQGANDDNILAFKSSDIAHGLTNIAETDTWCFMGKSDADTGGFKCYGLTEATRAFEFSGVGVTDDTTKSTSANAYITFSALKKSNGGGGDCGADANLMIIRNRNTARFIFDAEGSAHADEEWIAFQEQDDLALISDIEETMLIHQGKKGDKSNKKFKDKKDRLEESKLVVFEAGDSKHAMVNLSRLHMLQVGALRQINQRLLALED